MIPERSDTIVFVEDYSLQTIYDGLNVLFRRDLTSGALKTWGTGKDNIMQYRQDNQFISQAWSEHFIVSSDKRRQIRSGGMINDSPAPGDGLKKYKTVVPRVLQSIGDPFSIILPLPPNTALSETAANRYFEFRELADNTKCENPMLWIGPSAAGHVEIKDRKEEPRDLRFR
ncbi:uncharacterized protein Z518_06334 [Rhinocladiella mackenziei CBS 650.93]|uniref:Uncharacterized protein n=1 Tax=Rhinocladiella mackenziei CBS 650.93 TaxID=1442369 RepID=A0A0D2FTQ2_9EURO|nr:uncharacterized protein Z518_06334 [Rhinocladiella mackenziei CBS 650.93]KIX05462.1 hypothetical protein Z518_06334 [Rhinocladiella mackenziei CBS 650.93]